VAAAAVILAPGTRLPEVDDSKRLDPATRERLAPVIKARALAWAVAFVEPEEIDRLNIRRAGLEAMRRALAALRPPPAHLLVDGNTLVPRVTAPQQAIVGGDGKSLSIAAASVLAKTARDAVMCAHDQTYPGYGFAQHKGYPVAAHVAALRRLGPCPLHRRSFARVREALAATPGGARRA
jgi:ribonuclease HII